MNKIMFKKFKKTMILIRNVWNGPAATIKNIMCHKTLDEHVEVKGWIRSVRKLKENTFLDVGDGSTSNKLEVIATNTQTPSGLSPGASIIINGKLAKSSKGGLQLRAERLQLIGECVLSEGYPFLPRKSYTPEYVRQYLHFRPRTNRFASLLRVRSFAMSSARNYLQNNNFIEINTPILTSNDCEGAGEVFKVVPDNVKDTEEPLDREYFDTKTFLSVSGQLHLEAAAYGLGRVYTLGPTFRAENSKSRLHLSEFYMLEAEIAFAQNLETIMNTVEDFLKTVTVRILNECENDIENCTQHDQSTAWEWTNKKFCILTYDEAINIVEKGGEKVGKRGLTKELELLLVKHSGDVPTFIINWPKEMKPFYMKQCEDDVTKVAAFDLLVPNVGELVGGSLREDDYAKLQTGISSASTELNWYLELRKFGAVLTGGFGMGFERYLQFILGISNIKDTLPFPRWPHNCKL